MNAFTVHYLPTKVEPEQFLEAIAELGFSPRLEGADSVAASGQDAACEPRPALIEDALRQSKKDGKLLFLDFFAEWCAPCHTLEEEILPAPPVQAALASYHFLRVDTDVNTQTTQCP